jgi:hypothetical protein
MAEAWSSVFSNSKPISVAVIFGHLAGVVIAGGSALAADRRILRAAVQRGDRAAVLADLPGVHRVAVRGLALIVLTGVLLVLSDLETFLASPVFYVKGALFVLLLLNGALLTWAERRSRAADPEADWARLRWTAMASTGLWLATLLAGVWLTKSA